LKVAGQAPPINDRDVFAFGFLQSGAVLFGVSLMRACAPIRHADDPKSFLRFKGSRIARNQLDRSIIF
jgi:hypothetical protein